MFTNLEGKNQSNSGELILPMNIKMINSITVNLETQTAIYEEEQITFINVVARKQGNYQQNNKGYIQLNDDTGIMVLTIPLRSEIDQNLYIKLNLDENKTNYYNFILRARIYQNSVVFDVQAVQQVEQTAMIIYHIIRLGTWRLQMKQKKTTLPEFPQKILNNSLLVEESQPTQNNKEVTLKEQILNQIKISGQNGKTVKELENEFIKQGHYNIQEIKKTVKNLSENKSIQQAYVTNGETYYIQNE